LEEIENGMGGHGCHGFDPNDIFMQMFMNGGMGGMGGSSCNGGQNFTFRFG
jgi:hypothetical protein